MGFAMWACVTFPLTVLGGIVGRHRAMKQGQLENPFPCKTNKLAREVPTGQWYQSPLAQMFATGFLPFSAIYIELHYIFNSVWGPRIYSLRHPAARLRHAAPRRGHRHRALHVLPPERRGSPLVVAIVWLRHRRGDVLLRVLHLLLLAD